MTQEQLARRSGATRRTILDIEQGRRTPSTLLAYRLAAVLGIPVTELFSLP
jgi:putative transcriptional regulator